MKVVRVLLVLIFLNEAIASPSTEQIRHIMPEMTTRPLIEVISRQSRIINGVEAPRKFLPYQVGMQVHYTNGFSWCGGALISNECVLTAAHCIHEAIGVTMEFGARDRMNKYEDGQVRQYVDRNYFIIHEGWNGDTLRNDIALIRLINRVKYTEYIQPIALPSRVHEKTTFEESPIIASGWGYTSDTSDLARYMQFVDSTVLNQNKCCDAFGNQWVQDTNICMDGSTGASVCFGDSGGPIATTNGMRYVVGVSSFLHWKGCGYNYPSVFTRVSSYLDWISANTGIEIH